MKAKYVFIVGLPRTGTKLVNNILRKSPFSSYCISHETHFLGHFLRRGVRHQIKKVGSLTYQTNVHKLVDCMYSGKFKGSYWRQLSKGNLEVTKQTFLEELLKSPRRDRDIFDIIIRIHAKCTENVVLGDKTPSHLYHIPTLLKWYPEAKIIHTFRDPRAIFVSEYLMKKKYRSRTFCLTIFEHMHMLLVALHVAVTWTYAVHLHRKYSMLYPENYYCIKFEDLVLQPEKNIRDLCNFLGDAFHKQMLSPPKAGSSYPSDKINGIDKKTLTRWRSDIEPWIDSIFLFLFRKYFRKYGY